GGEIGWTDGEGDRDRFEMDDHEQLGFEIVASDRRAEIDLALDHPALNRSAYFLLWQRVDRLLWQRRYLRPAEPKRGKLLPGHFHLDTRILSTGPCAPIAVFRGGLSLPQPLRPFKRSLLDAMLP